MKTVDLLRNTVSIKKVAEITNLSINTVIRILDTIGYDCPKLGDSISIDEFKGNAETGKYQCILVNPKKRTILDILLNRTHPHLSEYFRKINGSERYRVKYFV